MTEHPDLTAELDAAEDIVTGRAEAIVTEWGVRYGDEGRVAVFGSSPRSERLARMDAAASPDVLVRRTVTYGPWETAEENDG